ncbi:pancreatic lipase-related protein 2-like [Tachypleus tridentatus]|uniref:pancreatic lipase-related protein 2-like n=2 Tax=Tachypleus tridentatus TaxID=6853 RepID=UPI003FCFE072
MQSKQWWVLLVFILRVLHVRTQNGEEEKDKDDVLKRCYEKYGCFSIGEPFLSVYRPINMFPYPPDALNVHFLLTSRENPNHFQIINTDDTSKSDLDPDKPIKVLVHDYLEDVNHPWLSQMIQELLTHDDYNIISVDWSRGSTSSYTQTVANARMVGAIIAEFLKNLEVAPTNIHIIGHGVGAHIAGYTGERVPGLGRITGLDPAGPYFQKTDPKVHLDPSDAEFVDVIHTKDKKFFVNGREIDQVEPSGHLDFYPNGGKKPSGCSNTIGHLGNCETVPSWKLFTESINTDCPFYGYVCDSFTNFTSAKCTDGCGDRSLCASLGFRANDWQQYKKAEPVKMYLSTDKSTPACRYHYHVKAKIAEHKTDDKEDKAGPFRGLMTLRITGSKKQTQPFQTTSVPVLFSPEKEVEFLLSSTDLGSINRIDAEWKPVNTPFGNFHHNRQGSFAPFNVKLSALPVERFEVNNLESGIRTKFCSPGEPDLYPNEVKPFFKSEECV